MKFIRAFLSCAGLVAASPADAAAADAAGVAATRDVSLQQDAFTIYSSKNSSALSAVAA